MINKKNIKFGLLNAGSLGTNQDEFRVAMSCHRVDVMAINETWLRASQQDRAPSLPGYRLKHIPRPEHVRRGRGGGVGFYIHNSISTRSQSHPQCTNIEQFWLNLKTNGKSVLIGTAYRPPWQVLSEFLDGLTEAICGMGSYDHLILLGDLNVDMLNTNCSKNKQMQEFLTYLNLKQVVQSATHFIGDSSSLIDVICTDNGMKVRNVVVDHIKELGHHSFVTCEVVIKKEKPKPRMVLYRPIKNILQDHFQIDRDLIPWSVILEMTDVNIMVQAFNYFITQLFDLHAPLVKKTFKDRPTPWITDNVKLLFKLRDKARCRAHKTGREEHKKYYLGLKNQAAHALKSDKKAYFNNFINSNIRNPKALWKNLKLNVLPQHNDSYLPEYFNDANAINEAFLDVPGNCWADVSQLAYFEHNRFSKSTFSLRTVDQTSVLQIINSLESNAQGRDGINLDMLALTLPSSLQAITGIINQSIITCTFPELWKCAIIKPIPKISNPETYKDLRPISILPVLSKVLERVVHTQIIEYLETNNILPDLQSGFRKGRSTASALSDVVGNILESRDQGEASLLILLDFSRAFDAINISLLISKLIFYGFDQQTVTWFRSYLTNRSQCVEIRRMDGSITMSADCHVLRGVPQGSILGPLLFIIYSADVINCFKNCRYHMYADDVQLYTSFKPKDTHMAIKRIDEDLERTIIWAEQNTLVLNPNKTKFMVLGSKHQIEATLSANPKITILGREICKVDEALNLGLLMDKDLRFEKHVNNILRNCFYKLKVLYEIRDYISEPLRKQLSNSLILSRLNYCDIVYGPCLLNRTECLIQRIQNACARFCFRIPKRNHVTPYLNKHHILKMTARRKIHYASFIYSIIATQSPQYLYYKLEWKTDKCKFPIRSNVHPLIVPKYRTAAFRGSFKYAATHCWNILSPPQRQPWVLSV